MAPRKPIKTVSKPSSKTEQKPDPKVNKQKKKSNEPSLWHQLKAFASNERMHFIVGTVILLAMFYLVLAFVSYFFTGAADQSKMDLPLAEIRQMRNEIQNWTSVVGAVIANNFLHKWFGISSFAMVIFGSIVGLKLVKVKSKALWKHFLHSSFWLIWLSITLGFAINPYVKSWLFFAPGGLHGEYVSNWIISYIGIPGIIFLSIGTLLTYSVLSSKATIPFLKTLFKKKNKAEKLTTELFDEDNENEPSVAIGTEIVPEGWVSNINDKTEETTKETEKDAKSAEQTIELETNNKPSAKETKAEGKDVSFEIEKPVESTEIVATETEQTLRTTDINEDPFYNLAKLGKYDPTLDLSHYIPPTVDLLKIYGTDNDTRIDMIEQNANKDRIIKTLQNYGIEIDSIKATVGPTITLYEIVPTAGVRISKIRNLEYDIMLSLAATGIRIIAPIPGKGTIGIEVPNADPQIVSMHSIIASKKFQDSKFELPIAFGRTITNDVFMVDLTKMPHLLVAGATGQGKSVGLNAVITSLLYKKHPAELKLVLVDPKKVEFNIYGDIEKHFLAKLPDGEDAIITDITKVVETLNSLCMEMDERYDLLKKAHVRNIKEYNEKFYNRYLNPEKGHRFLPYIVVIVDEFGDLIMTAGKEVEMPIARIAQLARAVGIHMILATQRPSVNIITGVIKANFPARVAFKVSSMMDSRTILDSPGANQLVGRGDMLFSQGNDLVRVQCAFVDTPEVEKIVHHIGRQQSYPSAFYLPEYVNSDAENVNLSSVDMAKRDVLFEEAARLIVANQQGSTSLIQRKFSIGYNRAGRIVDQLEVAGIVGPFEGSKARQVLVLDDNHLDMIIKQL